MRIHELGHIVFYVSDLSVMADFYRDTLGFHEIARELGMALFSSGRTHHEMLLLEIGGSVAREQVPQPGLYHVGFCIGNSLQDIKTAYRELRDRGVTIVGSADHGVTLSLYILDPEGNEVELYADVSDVWKKDPKALLQPPRPLRLET